jgi:uncharacterized protein YcnI
MSKVKVNLAKKVKYHGERNTAGAEIEIDEKDVEFFKENELISEVKGEVEQKNKAPEEPDEPNEENEFPTDEKLDEMTVAELMDVAQDLQLEGRSSLRNDKDELLTAVKETLAEKDGE